MANFEVAAGTDWISTIVFGSASDRWRLDDYDILAHVREPGDATVLLELSLNNGRLVISSATARRLEINVGWALIDDLAAGAFEFDVLLTNKTTGVRSRSGPHTLTVTPGITFSEA